MAPVTGFVFAADVAGFAADRVLGVWVAAGAELTEDVTTLSPVDTALLSSRGTVPPVDKGATFLGGTVVASFVGGGVVTSIASAVGFELLE